MIKRIRNAHYLNVEGDFYVEYGLCIFCEAAPDEAPDLLVFDENSHCYFKKQPETDLEIQQAVNAVCASELCALRYAGSDSSILKRLPKELCDIYHQNNA